MASSSASSPKLLLLAVALVVVVAPSMAHICMWEPPQRGGFDISGPAQNPCYRKVGPCGTTEDGPVTSIPAGEMYTVHFQQNANHYYTGKPGALVVDWAEGNGPDFGEFTELLRIPDYNAMGELTQTNFTKDVMIPSKPCKLCTLRVRYISNNPLEDPQGHGPTFFQCANVAFEASAHHEEEEEEAESTATAVAPPASDDGTYHDKCCSPASFSTNFVMDKPMTRSKGTIFYDNTTHMMREDVVHGDGSGTTATNGQFVIYSNFTSGDGFYYDVNSGKCLLGGGPFGLDLWNEWCFGSMEENEKYSSSGPCPAPATGMCNFYENGDWMFGATTDQCLPASLLGSNGNAGSVTYYGALVAPLPPSLFVPPKVCTDMLHARRLTLDADLPDSALATIAHAKKQ